jgi:hypothetical protein
VAAPYFDDEFYKELMAAMTATIDDFEITVEPRRPSAEEYARLREEVMRSATRVSGARTRPAKEHSRGRAATSPGR